MSRVIDVACGTDHTLLLTAEHTILSMGSNMNGQLGIGVCPEHQNICPVPTQVLEEDCQHNRPIAISAGAFSVMLTDQGDVYQWGVDCIVCPTRVDILRVKEIHASRGGFAAGISRDG